MTSRDKYLNLLYYSVGPTYYISRALGLLPVRVVRTKNQIRITSSHDFLYFGFFLLTYLFLSSYTIFALISDEHNYKEIPKGFLFVISVMILTSQIITVIMAYVMRKPLLNMIERFAEIDMHFGMYNIKMDYKTALMKNRVAVGWLTCSVLIRSAFTLQNVSVDFIQQYAVFAASFMKSQLKYLFIIFVEALYVRLSRLNESIAAGGDMKALSLLHFKLCNCCSILIHIFGLQMVMAVGVSAANVIFQNYFLYRMCTTSNCKEHFYMIGAPLFWILDEMLEIGLLVKFCSRTANVANYTPVLLHEMRNRTPHDDDLAREVLVFI
ncbi:PREDICTED: uncharacterized protein LOC108568652 [Nicrophorus vespilloides]|uniref:Gustatory receptor n=1 Tax=Nicrophorus vespilloides TaxID=110193 RepID=A0ABM1NEU9_NICVS|nr:PREDICTED: uncharacterized protein LOC108568652 [Nicrophorus vespilloides]